MIGARRGTPHLRHSSRFLLPLPPRAAEMASGTTVISLFAALVALLAFYARDPANAPGLKKVIEPLLIALPIGYHGHHVGDIFKHADLVQGENFGTEGCEVVKGGLSDPARDWGTLGPLSRDVENA